MKKNKGVCSTRFLSSLVAIVVLKQGVQKEKETKDSAELIWE